MVNAWSSVNLAATRVRDFCTVKVRISDHHRTSRLEHPPRLTHRSRYIVEMKVRPLGPVPAQHAILESTALK